MEKNLKMKNKIIEGDCLKVLKKMPNESVDCIVTSPPYYGLRDYGVEGQLGAEKTLEEYIASMLLITSELKRVLKKGGTMWWNHGDSYAGSNKGAGDKKSDPKDKNRSRTLKPEHSNIPSKSLMLQGYRLAMRMIDEQGWILRNQVIWHKPNVMPSSVKDRLTVDFESVFFFTKDKDYFFETQYEPLSPVSIERVKYGWKSKKANASAKGSTVGIDVEEMGARFANPKGRNKRTVWKIPTSNSQISHVAMYPEKLIETPILAGCPQGGVLLDPFFGAGTSGVVAKKLGRKYIGIEINPEYIKIAKTRIENTKI